jgi:hypothetical protein
VHHPSLPLLLAAALIACACAPVQDSPPAPLAVVWIPHPAAAAPSASAYESEPSPRRRALAERHGRQPNHFWFVFLDDNAERRDWLRVSPEIWEERYPNGAVTRYLVTGRINDGGRAGIIVRRMPDEAMEVFIPDLGTGSSAEFRVAPGGDWHALGQIHLIE